MNLKIGVYAAVLVSISIGSIALYRTHKKTIAFDASMQVEKYQSAVATAPVCTQWYAQMKELYERHNPDTVVAGSELKIPKIIHQIWLGGPFPEEYKAFSQSWFAYHPQWQFVLWTDHPELYLSHAVHVSSFDQLQSVLTQGSGNGAQGQFIIVDVRNLFYENKHFFDEAKNYGERSDILKWELIYRIGGLYVDTDYECVRALDDLHYKYDFYTGIQPLDTGLVQLGAALYAAYPGHPILKQCVEGIKQNQHIKQIIAKTGPIHFTKSFIAQAGKNGSIDVALPASYMYPRAYYDAFDARDTWLRPESYAVHHWAGSWLKPEGWARS